MTPALAVPPPLDLQRCTLAGTQLIEASAGTGKTWAICALVLRLLVEARLEIGQILVVTFTNAATAELRERIRARLQAAQAEWQVPGSSGDAFLVPWLAALRAAAGQDGAAHSAVGQRLAAALQGFDEAAVFTIHGFCQRALADAAFSAGMPLVLTPISDDLPLRQQVVNDFWRRMAPGLEPALAAYLLRMGDSPARWAQLLQRRLAKPMARLRWPDELDAAPDAAFDREPARAAARIAEIASALAQQWPLERAAVAQLLQRSAGALNQTRYKPDAVKAGIAAWDRWCAAPDPQATLEPKALLLTAASLTAATKKGERTPTHAFFDAAQAWLDARAAQAKALSHARLRLLRRLFDEAPAELAAAKRAQRVVAFDDMLGNLHQRLTGPDGAALAQALRERFPAALIDEFQDTDPLQWAIFDTVHGQAGAPLFLVGDPKQAIYSFRNADLPTYLAARASAHAAHTLGDNQRACAGLLEALNTLYARHALPFMLPQLEHHPVRLGAKPRPAFVDRSGGPPQAPLTLWRLPRDRAGRLLSAAEATAAAAQATAAEIARLLAAAQRGAVTLGGRALAAGDIAVLVRSHRQGSAVRQALAQWGVGSVELSQDSVFASPDAEALEHILAAVLEPTREPLLKAALATSTLGLDAPALLALADDEPAWLARVQRFAGWRALWQQRGIGTLLRRLLADEGVATRLLPRPDGERRLTNLQHLAECLQRAAPEQGTPEALLRWLQAQRAEARADEATQLRLESDRHLVQIVTIHKSKGLEYALVYCPFLWAASKPPAHAAGQGQVWQDADGTTWIDFRDPDDRDFPAAEVDARQRLAAAAEDLRLVYVALTRAVQRCTLVVGAWGHGTHRSPKPAARAALSWLAAGSGRDPAQWLAPDKPKGGAALPKGAPKPPPLPTAAALDDAWTDVARQAAPHALLCAWPEALPGGPQPLPGSGALPEALAALPPPQRLPQPWRIGSYSGLAHGARHELAAQDHDARSGETAADDPIADGSDPAPPRHADDDAAARWTAALPGRAADDILDFPRGPEAGDCLHAVFEGADFADPARWDAAIADALREHGPALAAAARGNGSPPDAARLARQLRSMLADVLATPLDAGPWAAGAPGGAPGGEPGGEPAANRLDARSAPLRLAAVPAQRRLAELAFHLPADGLDAEALNDLLLRHGYPMPRLGFRPLRGWLKGFIDLVLCHEGRWYVLDWKSNHLGERPQDYAPAALDTAMAHAGYHLQHLLYSVALRRWLRQRVAGFDAARHFGGVLYLFVRGVRPGWRLADGTPCGVWRQRPGEAVLDELSALLDGAAGGGG